MLHKIMTVVVLLLGLGLAGTGANQAWDETIRYLACTDEVKGVIKSIVRNDDGEGRTHHTFVAYTVAGIEYENKTPETLVNNPWHYRGESLTLFHDPTDPNRFYVPGEGNLSIILGLLITAFGLVAVVLAYKRKF